MDSRQLTNDPEEATRIAQEGHQSGIWTALPCVIKSVDFETMTCEAQPTIQGMIEDEFGNVTYSNYPLLVDVPICFPSGGGFVMTFPLAAGDEVLVVFASRCIDSWWQSGGIQQPAEFRMHDLSDGFAIPGPRSVPNVAPSISAGEVQIRNNAGTTYLSLTAGGKIGIVNATTDLKTVLTDLQSLLNTFMTTLAGFAGGGSPVSQASLQAPAAAAVTALAPVLTKIGALLK